MTSQQVSGTSSRQMYADDHRPVRSRRARDEADGTAASKADLDAARRRYFSIAEWNRQKVYHLRRASLRRACLTGIPVSWTQAGLPDCQQSRASATIKSRRRLTSRQTTTAASADCMKQQSLIAETKLYSNHVPLSLPPICEKPSVVSNNIKASRKKTTIRSDQKQNQDDSAGQSRPTAYTFINRCAPVSTLPAARHASRRTYTTSHRTPPPPPRPEAHEQTFSTHAQQQPPEACDNRLESDGAAAARSTTTDHQSVTPANVDLQKVKDVLENRPPSGSRTHNDDVDDEEERNSEETRDKSSVDANNCLQHVDSDTTRQTADLTRYLSSLLSLFYHSENDDQAATRHLHLTLSCTIAIAS